ncbi:MAG: fructosamine kinase family protein, partial [Rhodanobacteraceae bacterium]
MEPEGLLSGLPDGLHRLRTREADALVAKVRRGAPAGFFAAEARGLEALRATESLRVPRVYEVRADGILLEDLGVGVPKPSDWERAGADLAHMHRSVGTAFGFAADGWCGDSFQDNRPTADGYEFFRVRRLLAQAQRARERE